MSRRLVVLLAWVLWALAMLGLAAVPWMDRLTIGAGRPDLAQLTPGLVLAPLLGHLTATTVGAVLASRRPGHPVGWLLLGFALITMASGVIAAYVAYGLLARPGALPAAASVARYYPATAPAALALLSLVLLLTPTGSLPSPRWRWWAFITAATPVALVLVVPLAPGRFDPQLLVLNSPFSGRALGGVLLLAIRVALVVTSLAVAVAAGSLLVRYRSARGIERQQLRWVALGAALMLLAAPVVLIAVALGIPMLVDWAAAVWVIVLPVAVGAAILRYRLFDLDRIISRTVVYGLLTAGGIAVYVGVVKGAEWLLREGVGVGGSLLATAVIAVGFAPARDRLQRWVDRRLYGERHDPVQAMSGLVSACGTPPVVHLTGMPSPGCYRGCARPCGCPRPACVSKTAPRWRPLAGRAPPASRSPWSMRASASEHCLSGCAQARTPSGWPTGRSSGS
jgi:hypothetical protein